MRCHKPNTQSKQLLCVSKWQNGKILQLPGARIRKTCSPTLLLTKNYKTSRNCLHNILTLPQISLVGLLRFYMTLSWTSSMMYTMAPISLQCKIWKAVYQEEESVANNEVLWQKYKDISTVERITVAKKKRKWHYSSIDLHSVSPVVKAPHCAEVAVPPAHHQGSLTPRLSIALICGRPLFLVVILIFIVRVLHRQKRHNTHTHFFTDPETTGKINIL